MSEEELKFVDDKLFVYTPIPQYGDGICKTQLVMTKDIFQECYKKWIVPQQSEGIMKYISIQDLIDHGKELRFQSADQMAKVYDELPSITIIHCKDCRKHNISTDAERNICPLTWFRGKAQGHEFDYQFCVYGERKEQ